MSFFFETQNYNKNFAVRPSARPPVRLSACPPVHKKVINNPITFTVGDRLSGKTP